MTHFPEDVPRVLPRGAGGRGVNSTPDPGVAGGGPSDGWGGVGAEAGTGRRRIVLGNELENAFRRQIRPSPLAWF